jgi:hypothetical protein
MAYRRELWRIVSGSEVRFMCNITPLDLTKSASSTSLSTNVPSLVPIQVVNSAAMAIAALQLAITH